MSFEGIKRLADRREKRRKLRKKRMFTQFNLKTVFVFMIFASVLALYSPNLWNHFQRRFGEIRENSRKHQQKFEELKLQRPVADKYRFDRLTTNENGYVLHGECLINGVWKKYAVATRNGKIAYVVNYDDKQ